MHCIYHLYVDIIYLFIYLDHGRLLKWGYKRLGMPLP